MATQHPARTDTIVLKIDGNEVRLSVTTRYPLNQEGLPEDGELARIRTGTVMKYTLIYRQAFQWQEWDYDTEARSAIHVVSGENEPPILPSLYDPYVTVWQQHWGHNNPPSLTLHSWDNGNSILALNRICEESNLKLAEIFAIPVRGIEPIFMSSFSNVSLPVPKQNQSPQNQSNKPPVGSPQNPIGGSQNNAPDTSKLKPYVRGVKPLAEGLISIQTGKGDGDYTKHAKLQTSYDYKNPPKEDGFHAYLLNQVAWNVGAYTPESGDSSLYVNIPLATSNIRIFDRGGEHNYEWSSLARHLGFNDSDGLRALAGNSFFVPANYIVMKKSGNFMNYFGLYEALESF